MVAVNFLGEWFQREKSIRHVVKSTWHDQSFSYFINSFCENHLSFANTDTDLETDLSLVKFCAVENILWRLGQWYHTCTKQPLKSWGKICPQKVHLLLQFEICTSSCQSFPWGNFQCTSSLWKREFSSAFFKVGVLEEIYNMPWGAPLCLKSLLAGNPMYVNVEILVSYYKVALFLWGYHINCGHIWFWKEFF